MRKKKLLPLYIFTGLLFLGIINAKFVGRRGVGNLTPDEPNTWSEIWANLPFNMILCAVFTIIILLLFKKVRKDVDKNREIELKRIKNIVKFHSPVQTHECRVCGYCFEEFPWGEDGKQPSYQICSCCGVQFGKEDITPEDIKQYRAVWKKKGYKWHDKTMQPDNWDLNEQLNKSIYKLDK